MAKKVIKKTKPKRSQIKRVYNWRPDLPDYRDHLYLKVVKPMATPDTIDLRPQCSPIVNQGKIGSCTGNALAGAIEFVEKQELKTKSKPASEVFATRFAAVSRLFIYYNERALEGTTTQDAGGRLRDGVKTLTNLGVCRESTWQYKQTLLFNKPTVTAFKEALQHCISEYLKVQTLVEIKQCLAQGYPVAFGFSVYESFESPEVARSGQMPLPAANEQMLGGHAVLAVGYQDATQTLIVRNSWGTEWGDNGYFYMPYAYIEKLKLAQDFWTIRK
jgi:C1A family cysteine protease